MIEPGAAMDDKDRRSPSGAFVVQSGTIHRDQAMFGLVPGPAATGGWPQREDQEEEKNSKDSCPLSRVSAIDHRYSPTSTESNLWVFPGLVISRSCLLT